MFLNATRSYGLSWWILTPLWLKISHTQLVWWFSWMSVIGKRPFGYFAETEQKFRAKLVCPSSICLILTSFETAEFKVRKWTRVMHLRARMAWRAQSYFHFQCWNKIMHHNLMGNCQHPWLERAPTVCVEREKKLILGGTKVLRGNIFTVPSFSRGPHALRPHLH